MSGVCLVFLVSWWFNIGFGGVDPRSDRTIIAEQGRTDAPARMICTDSPIHRRRTAARCDVRRVHENEEPYTAAGAEAHGERTASSQNAGFAVPNP